MNDVVRLSVAKTVPIEVEIALGDLLRGLSDEQLRAECVRRGIGGVAETPTLTGEQIRGARGMLDWPQPRLARAAGVSTSTIKRLEDGSPFQTRACKAAAIRRALQDGGVHFVSVGGVAGVLRAGAGPLRSEPAEVIR